MPLLTVCLAKDPAVRPTAAQLSSRLEERAGRIGRWPEECPTALAGELTEAEHAARTVVDLATPVDQESALTTIEADTVLAAPDAPGRRRRPAWLLTTAVAAVAVVGAVVAAVHFGTQRSSAESSPPAQGQPSASATPQKTPSASAQQPQDKGAALKVIQATFELATGDSVGTGARTLTMQQDGNLVVAGQDHTARWATMTAGEGNSARFQTDGNLVVYNSGGQPLWSSQTDGHQGAVLVFQADGNIVIKSGDTVLWAAGTDG
ncbi:hypothetical protein [Streptomyces shenzhenensis]|uniref:hypothetical protein n=1 Tax=Streptomyces shenzhenensis TaxID=943815 RepID=UPI00369235FC